MVLEEKGNNKKYKRKIKEKGRINKIRTFFLIPSPSTTVNFGVVKIVCHCNQQERKNKNKKENKKMSNEKKQRRTYSFCSYPLCLIGVFICWNRRLSPLPTDHPGRPKGNRVVLIQSQIGGEVEH